MPPPVYRVSQKFYPLKLFSDIFSQWLRLFKQNFTRLLYVDMYTKLQNFIQLSLNLTKLYHMSTTTDFTAREEWPPNSSDLNQLDYYVWSAMLEAFHKLHSNPRNIP